MKTILIVFLYVITMSNLMADGTDMGNPSRAEFNALVERLEALEEELSMEGIPETGGEESEEPLVLPMTETMTIGIESAPETLAADAAFFFIELDSWYAENVRTHWNAPSNWQIDLAGNWFFYARRIANFHRKHWDTGYSHNYRIDAQFYENYDAATKKCTGRLIHSQNYYLGHVSYKQEKWDTNAQGRDLLFAQKVDQMGCVTTTRWIY